jgi:hypothetical protein
MPFQPELQRAKAEATPSTGTATTSDWQQRLPVLSSTHVTLRELRI